MNKGMTMNRFFLFCGNDDYPSGGMDDFAGDFSTMTEALEGLGRHGWWHVLDTRTGQVYNRYHVNGDRMEWAAAIDAEEGEV